MREVDRRSKHSRRTFLKGVAAAAPVAAIATSIPFSIEDTWAADATALQPASMKTLVKVARDIYPHDMLVDSYYVTAIKPWDGKAAKDAAVKTMIEDGVKPSRSGCAGQAQMQLRGGGVGSRSRRAAARY